MIFLHDSVKTEKFKNDKKLSLLNQGIITQAQFINLIEPDDEYMLFGPVIIDKSKLNDFILEWKTKQIEFENENKIKKNHISIDDIINKFDELSNIFESIIPIIKEFREKIKVSSCFKCTKTRYVSEVILEIKNKLDENPDMDLGDLKYFIYEIIDKKDIIFDRYSDETEFDIEWIKPEELVGLGNDLIEKLSNCFECSIKHIGRAKILFEEFNQGYPDHKEILFNEFSKGNKDIELFCLKYFDICAQLDMGSCELVGSIDNLDKNFSYEIIELANEIRKQRLLFQEDISNIPDFDKLRLDIKKLELKIINK